MTDTPKDIHLAIWELLTPEERPGFLYANEAYDPVLWHNGCGEELLVENASRIIVDAAREVLDLDYLMAYKCPVNKKDWCIDAQWDYEDGGEEEKFFSQPYPTRTEAIYRALKWLRGQKR
jgi:hypothetical protein